MTQSNQTPDRSGAAPNVTEEKLMVAVRVRPQRADEGARIVHVVSDKMLVLEEEADARRDVLRARRGADRHYVYDRVFGEDSTQGEIYEHVVAPLVTGALQGFAGAVFAYGATGAGKTHTMTGMMGRALSHLFSAIDESGNPAGYEVKMSYLEIYNENIKDLLNPTSGHLELRDEGGSSAPVVAGLSEVRASSAAHVAELLARGDRARTAEPTHANEHSSRGHTLLSVTVLGRSDSGLRRGRLFLIDLAGSERAGLRARRLEGAHINRSLLALANCIMALSGGARYVNYRDSKLTRLLREVLGGRCRTAMIAHVAPGAGHRETTRSTLHYAQRAASITNRVEREFLETPKHLSQYRTVISELREEISRLKGKMKDDRTKLQEDEANNEEQEAKTEQETEESAAHLKALRESIISTFKQQMRLRRRLMELDSHLLGLALDAEKQHAAISHWEARFNRLYKPISMSGSRISTQQSYRGGTVGSVSGAERAEAEVAVEQAWAELAGVERSQEAARDERARVTAQLEAVRRRGARLEQELPERIASGPEREVLALVCRVHELEADKLSLQGSLAARAHELRRRDAVLQRRDATRTLSDEIITRQRTQLHQLGAAISPELAQLYELYQQEIHASTYTEGQDHAYRLPPISTSMSELAWSESSSGSGRGSSSGSTAPERLPRLAPAPRPPTRYSHASALKRYSSDDSLVMAAPRGGHADDP
ncbi:kinesin-like protein KIF19 [Plutella xylostella]|uniref:kinesin-like protein KIF19 n=1 Tax=Plutella xylostella TaxID=51655 RepID=UPI0020321F22|nr:kinesin-like protein KIF19 [Plutella xylostella]